ncbi:hypothetical protein MATL_G00264140 [Megalops atlanticus]|uniref:Uncharacterized protein n=1 Tax=Megalops atlanticus TaxID=7932 RepID=A0A9D3SZE4_MEGAT|nr:hypothetical protein MATL_G00264140 [Megalops atlanticus]
MWSLYDSLVVVGRGVSFCQGEIRGSWRIGTVLPVGGAVDQSPLGSSVSKDNQNSEGSLLSLVPRPHVTPLFSSCTPQSLTGRQAELLRSRAASAEEATTNRPFYDRRTYELCPHHTCGLRGYGDGVRSRELPAGADEI